MKKVISFVLILALCMSFAGCTKQEEAKRCAGCNGTVDTKGEYCSACEASMQTTESTVKEPADLTGKTIIWNGDSICAGREGTGNWADRIAERNEMTGKNFAVAGGTIADGMPLTQSGNLRHSVCGTIDKMYKAFPDADYIIFEGGTNDADLLGNALGGSTTTRLGTVDPDDFSGKYDFTTFCGALETVFFRAKSLWSEKKIGFIIAPKMGRKGEPLYNNRRAYFDKAIEICEKWDIPYIDLWNDSELDPSDISMYNMTKTPEQNMLDNTGYYIDGQHLTAKGYDVITELIEAWLKLL